MTTTNTDDGQSAPLTRTEPIGRFLVLRRLGVGGTAVVWSAYDPELDRKVAIKVVHGAKVANSTAAGDRLRREAQALAKLNHPNVVAIYDAGTCAAPGGGKEIFIAEELVEGVDVARWLRERPRSRQEILEVFLQAGQGLLAAHGAGLVHRDFKPGNILVGADGRVRVSDFGLARAAMSGETAQVPLTDETLDDTMMAESTPLSTPLTEVGAIMGTPSYMAPEQHLGHTIDSRADQFSFCVALYEALYGEKPFAGKTIEEIRLQVLQGKVRVPPKNSRVPSWLRLVLLRGLRVEAAERFPTMAELLAALQRDPVRRRLVILSVAGVVVVLLGLVGGILTWQQREARMCVAEAEDQASAWNDESANAIRNAFEATGKPYALDTYDRVRSLLAAYHDTWVEGYIDACAATHVRHGQSEPTLQLRRACLWERRAALEELITVLTKADEGMVRKAVETAMSLRPIKDCADVARLSMAVTPPEDEAVRTKVAELGKELARAKVLEAAGSYKAGEEVASKVAAAAKETGYPPIVADALLELGTIHDELGLYGQAEDELYEAWWAAVASGYLEIEARVGVLLVRNVGCLQGRPKDGARLARHSRAIIDRLDRLGAKRGYDDLEADWTSAMANLAFDAGDYDKALDYNRQTIAIRERTRVPDHPLMARDLLNRAVMLETKGDYDAALDAYRRALEIEQKVFGPKHPRVAVALSAFGGSLVDTGHYQEGMDHQLRALAIAEEANGRENPDTIRILDVLCFSRYRGHDYDTAIECYRKVLALQQHGLGDEHPRVGKTLSNISELLRRTGQYAEVFPMSTRALDIATKTFGPDHPDVATARNNLGCAYLATGSNARALENLEKAVAICEKVECDENIRPEARFALGRALWSAARDRPRALELAKAARDEYAKTRGSEDWRQQVDDWLTTVKAK